MPRHHHDRQRLHEREHPAPEGRDPRHRYALTAVVLMVAGLALAQGVQPAVQPVHEDPSAVIVDQLSLTVPNATFIAEATQILEDAGYIVDYVPGENVTVELYRSLPQSGYDVVVLRAHSSATKSDGSLRYTSIFAGETYNEHQYQDDRHQRRVERAIDQTGNEHFAVTPRLFEKSRGTFDDGTIIVMMGCQGLTTSDLARSFITKGASAYIGWTTWITADRTDTAALAFLGMHLAGGQSIVDAVQGTNALVGEDEEYGSKLNAVGKADAMLVAAERSATENPSLIPLDYNE